MKKISIMFFILLVITNITFAQKTFNKDSCMITAKKVIQLIKDKEYKKTLGMFPDNISKTIKMDELIKYIDSGADYIEKYGIPGESDILKKANFVPSDKDGIDVVYSLIFPFPAPKVKKTMPERMIEIGFLAKYGNSKIVILNIGEVTPIKLN